jgi:hypothetical protein
MINDDLVDRAGSIYAKTAGDFNERMVAVVALVTGEALGPANQVEISAFKRRLSGLVGEFDLALEFFLRERKSRLTAAPEVGRVIATPADERVAVSRR